MFCILRDGEIMPADAHVDTSIERPIVWFSRNQYWERTVTKGFQTSKEIIVLGMQGMVGQSIRLFRIGVLPLVAPHNWTALRKLSGMDSRIANGLVRSARDLGANPQDWFGTFDPVKIERWEMIEEFIDDRWIDARVEKAAA